MPKKSQKNFYRLSTFSKLLLASTLLLITGYTYQLVAYGDGPLSSIFAAGNTINLVNGLDPEEAAYIQKAIKPNSISATSATSKQLNVIVKNPVNEKEEKAKIRFTTDSTPVTTPNDGLEAAEAAFLQNSINIDKAPTGTTGVSSTMPTVKVTVTNPDTGLEETSMVKLDTTKQTDIKELTNLITKKVVKVNSINLSRGNALCDHPTIDNLEVAPGDQIDNGNGTCSTCRIKSSSGSYAGVWKTSRCIKKYISGSQKCNLYKRPTTNNPYDNSTTYSTTPSDTYNTLRHIYPGTNNYVVKIDSNNTVTLESIVCTLDANGQAQLTILPN